MSAQDAALIVEHAPFVWRVLIHLGVPKNRLEDASQEVFLVLLSGKFSGHSALETFLYGVCRNVASVERRRQRDAREVVTDELPETVVQPAQEGELWIKRAHDRLVQALERLDDAQREVFVLFELEQLSMEEIARAMQAPLSTCYSRLYAAREAVQAELRRRSLSEKLEASS
jgi:RNA polymerase sigma-70 factor (ECF subfamily)